MPLLHRSNEERQMLDTTQTQFSHVKPGDTPWRGEGLREFFLYRDLGVADATHGKVIAHLVKANMAPEKGTGWHRARHGVPRNREPRRLQDGGCGGALAFTPWEK